MSRLGSLFQKELSKDICKILDLKNFLSVPKLLKVVVSAGCGKHSKDQGKLDFIFDQISMVAGQLPVFTKAKKSVAGFSIREGMVSGVSVTLRNVRMYDFVDRLVNVSMPRIRDFHGVSTKAFDGNGNYNLGIKEHDIFVEAKDNFSFGMNIAFITSAKNDSECKVLLSSLGFPFKEMN